MISATRFARSLGVQSYAMSLLILFISSVKIELAVSEEDDGGRIVGGTNITNIKERPYMVAIFIFTHKHDCTPARFPLQPGFFIYNTTLMCKARLVGVNICGGSILNPRHVLTDEHCLRNYGYADADPNIPKNLTLAVLNFEFLVGCNRLSGDCRSSQKHNASAIFFHPDASGDPPVDMAIARLASTMTINDYVQPVNLFSHDPQKYLAEYKAMLQHDPMCWVTGYGKKFREVIINGTKIDEFNITKHIDPNSVMLKSASLNIIKTKECDFTSDDGPQQTISSDYRTCYVSPSGSEGACHGDSGGPVVCNGFLVGPVLGGKECGTARPQVFTNVLALLEWLAGRHTICGSRDCSDVLSPIVPPPHQPSSSTVMNITDIKLRPYIVSIKIPKRGHVCLDAKSPLPEGFFIYNQTLMCKETSFGVGMCGGTILNPRHVLTAHHCLYNYGYQDRDPHIPKNLTMAAWSIEFFVGCEFNVPNCVFSQQRRGSHFSFHPDNQRFLVDIAIAVLASTITFNDHVKPVKFFSHDTKKYLNRYKKMLRQDPNCWVTGYGEKFRVFFVDELPSNRETAQPETLKTARVNIIILKLCGFEHLKDRNSQKSPTIYRDYTTCVVSPSGGGGCAADSGGPITCNDHQVGVVSQAWECGSSKPQMMTNVLGLLEWLNSKQTICDSLDCEDVLSPISPANRNPLSGVATARLDVIVIMITILALSSLIFF